MAKLSKANLEVVQDFVKRVFRAHRKAREDYGAKRSALSTNEEFIQRMMDQHGEVGTSTGMAWVSEGKFLTFDALDKLVDQELGGSPDIIDSLLAEAQLTRKDIDRGR